MAFVPVFQILEGHVAPDGVGAMVKLWIETSRGNVLVVTRYLASPSAPVQITKPQAFALCKALANQLQAAEDAAVAAAAAPSFTDPTIYDATQAGAVAAVPANIAPPTGQAPANGASV